MLGSSLPFTPGSLADRFFAPLLSLLAGCRHTRECPSLHDAHWLVTGIARSLGSFASGRDFLQKFAAATDFCPQRSLFFETLKSKRRLALCGELNAALIKARARFLPDPFAAFPALAEFDLLAGDGHFHAAACHDPADGDGVRRGPGHVYLLDLRSHLVRHLESGDQLLRRKEHEMRLLKRCGFEALRAGAPAGRKVLMVYDRAAIDFNFWHTAKHQHGLYFLSRPKENMSLQKCGFFAVDREDPVNAGIVSDEQVGPATYMRLIRRITWQNPQTGELWQFITNEMTLPPGLLVLLYLKRWDIEKVFDEFKNKLQEKKAWAVSATAKRMQAQFLCLAHNLMVLEEERLRTEHGVTNTAEETRRAKRLGEHSRLAARAGHRIPSTLQNVQRLTQRSVKFVRWLQTFLFAESDWGRMLAVLRKLYAAL